MENSSCRHALIPSSLYSSPVFAYTPKPLSSEMIIAESNLSLPPSSSPSKGFLIPSPSEPSKIELHSPKYYDACTAGGILSCGLTHMLSILKVLSGEVEQVLV
ncbi:unnamed protein product [Cuscuta europaea]|uniref:Uncharacterized protein n=1 Tax=Cuscuta europaea TaxID=41803 RepID=A0A9P1DXL6_CUSEU|nr:unnamed protein product [Cuscuta europaea]